METHPASHPPTDVLLALGSGKLDEATAEAILFHVEACPECLKIAREAAGDSFFNRLRAGRNAPAPMKDLSTFPPAGNTAGLPTTSERPSPMILPELRDHPQYEVLRELGRGGMGVVYLAKNKLMDRLEVLKVVNKQLLGDAGATERFLREIRSAAQLNHPNIVTAYSALQIGDLLLFSMEYIEGRDLAEVVKSRGPLPAAHSGSYVLQAARGLQHAFEKGMIHRDIKPQNLILDAKKNVVKILDFGLAKATQSTTREAAEGLTGMNMMMGTPDYMAPEQARDAASVDIRADVYSLGCTLYCLLAGRAPFVGGSLATKIAAHQLSEPDPIESLRQDLPPGLAEIVRKMMAKDPAQRYQKPEEVVQALTVCFKGKAKQPTAKGSPVKVRTTMPVAAPKLSAKGESKSIFEKQTVAPIAAPRQTMRERPSPIIQVKTEEKARPRKKWLLAAGAAVALMLASLIGLWAAGVFKVKTADGILVVQVNEPNAEVFVDGDRTTVSWNDGGTKAEIHVKPGTRKVEVRKDGFSVDGAELTFKDGDRAIFTARLLPNGPRMAKADAPPPPEELPPLPEKPSPSPDTPTVKLPLPPDAPPIKPPPPPDTKKPEVPPIPVAVDDKGFVALFNGKNLKGWKTHSSQPGNWRVDNGVLVGSSDGVSHLYTDRGDYTDFDLRLEARLNVGNGFRSTGVYFRAPFGPNIPANVKAAVSHTNKLTWIGAYNAKIDAGRLGGLLIDPYPGLHRTREPVLQPGEWVAYEIIAEGNHFIIKVNGETTSDYTDEQRRYKKGHIVLQQHGAATVAEFRKIEIKELTPGKSALAPEKPILAPAPADPFQAKSVWVDGASRILTVIERKDERFLALYKTGNGIIREVSGTVKDGKLSWLAKDVRAIKGGVGGDNQATITSDKDGDLLEFTFSENGRTMGAFVLRLKTGK